MKLIFSSLNLFYPYGCRNNKQPFLSSLHDTVVYLSLFQAVSEVVFRSSLPMAMETRNSSRRQGSQVISAFSLPRDDSSGGATRKVLTRKDLLLENP